MYRQPLTILSVGIILFGAGVLIEVLFGRPGDANIGAGLFVMIGFFAVLTSLVYFALLGVQAIMRRRKKP